MAKQILCILGSILLIATAVYAGTFTVTSGGTADWNVTSGGTGDVNFTATVGAPSGNMLLEDGTNVLLEDGTNVLLEG